MMVGDAPGDETAADDVGIRFFPILPKRENESWRHFQDAVFPRFLADRYAPAAETRYRARFHDRLPELPPWLQPPTPASPQIGVSE